MRARTARDLGAAIRAARRRHGWTQADLAERAGVSRQWLISVESGQNTGAEMALVLRTLDAAGVTLSVGLPGEPAEVRVGPDEAAVGGPADPGAQAARALDLDRLIAEHTTVWEPTTRTAPAEDG